MAHTRLSGRAVTLVAANRPAETPQSKSSVWMNHAIWQTAMLWDEHTANLPVVSVNVAVGITSRRKVVRISIPNGKAGKMLRQESSPMGYMAGEKTAAQTLQDDADIEALRAAYRAVVTASAHSVFAAKAIPGVQQQASEPLLNAYHAAVAAFANSVFTANGLPVPGLETPTAQRPSSIASNPAPSQIPSHPALSQAQSQTGQPTRPQPIAQRATENRPLATSVSSSASSAPRSNPAPQSAPSQPSATSANPAIQHASKRPGGTVKENLFYTHLGSGQPSKTTLKNEAVTSASGMSRPTLPATSNALPAVPAALYRDVEKMTGNPEVSPSNDVPTFDFDIELPEKAASEKTALQNQAAIISQSSTKTPIASDSQDSVTPLPDDDYEFLDLPPIPESWLVKLFSRPKLAAGIIGMCVLTSSVYAGLGLWWLSNSSPVSNAAEPVNLLNVNESEQIHQDNKSLFRHIDSIQHQNNIIVPNESEGQSGKKPQRDLLALAPAATQSFDLQDIKRTISEPTGRPDPFEPLVGANGERQSGPEEVKKKDVLEDLQFTGFIGDINSKSKVAIIRVTDPTSGTAKTLIKKAGQSFTVEGEKVVLKGISKGSLLLSVSGETRVLSLNPYTETVASSSGNTAAQGAAGTSGSTAASGGTTNTATGASSGSAMGSSFGNIRALSGNRNPASPQLEEPN